MIRFFRSHFAALLTLCVVGGALVATGGQARAMDIERVTSPQGIEAWLVRDAANPIVSVRFAFRGGAALDPPGKAGLANLAASTMDEGAGALDSRAFQGRLADQAITLRFRAGLDQFSGQVQTLTGTLDEAQNLLRLALNEPRFDAEPVARIKSQIQAGIRRDSEDASTVAFEEMMAGLFPGHGYGRRTDGYAETVAAITRDDLVRFAQTRLATNNLKVAVVGDIAPERLGAFLDAVFSDLPATSGAGPVPDAQPKDSGRVRVIEKDVVQSAIAFGHGAVKRDHPDFYAALLVNHILGGGTFSSRLYDEIREKRGLAYSVGSGLYTLDRAGLIVGQAGTENARAGETLDIVREQWRAVAAGAFTAQELQDAKTYVTGAFPLSFTSTDKIAQALVGIQMDGLGIDYLDKREGFIRAVTLDQARRVAREILLPARLNVVVVGRPEGIE